MTTNVIVTEGVVDRVVVTVVIIVVDSKGEEEVTIIGVEVVGTLAASSILIRFLTKELMNIAAMG